MTAPASPPPSYKPSELSSLDYHRKVDHLLDEFTGQLEELLETQDIDALEERAGGGDAEWDVEYAVRTVHVLTADGCD